MIRYLAVAIALVASAAPASAETMWMPMGHSAVAKTPADKANADAMQKMMKAMAVKPTGNPDRDFVLMMLPHHQGAIDMAKVELQYGKDPELHKLATEIVTAQEAEITTMKAWLAAH